MYAEFYRNVAAYMLGQALSGGSGDASVGVVSVNWDPLLEDSLLWCIREMRVSDQLGVDYCCPVSVLDGSGSCSPLTPSVMGPGSVRFAKLHGSANWLSCPLCKRMFTGLGSDENVWRLYVLPRECPACQKLWQRSAVRHSTAAPRLEPFFVTPTFVKVFDDPHIRLTWHNAFAELSEADEVVFIGYSLPDADYHVRTLLRRAIHPDARITVVLTSGDEKKRNTPNFLRRFLPAERYRTFFGKERPVFDLSGVEGYFGRVMGSTSLRRRLAGIRRTLQSRHFPS